MSRTPPKDFDPQAIPHFNAEGRIGELDPDEPEERESSAQSEAGTEPAPGPSGSATPEDGSEGAERAGGDGPGA